MKNRYFLLLFPFFALAQENDSTPSIKQYSFQTMQPEQVTDKITRRYVYGKNEMLARFDMKKGAIVPMHNHPNEQITYILSGAVKVTTKEGKVYMVKAGELLVIPPGTFHMFEALEDTVDIDVFSPPRKDWIEKTDTYFKQK